MVTFAASVSNESIEFLFVNDYFFKRKLQYLMTTQETNIDCSYRAMARMTALWFTSRCPLPSNYPLTALWSKAFRKYEGFRNNFLHRQRDVRSIVLSILVKCYQRAAVSNFNKGQTCIKSSNNQVQVKSKSTSFKFTSLIAVCTSCKKINAM